MSITVADLVAKLGLDDSAFNRGLDRAHGGMSTFSRRTGAAGAAMTRGLTLPILAAGAVSVKMAADFEASMTLVQTQAGGTAKDVKFLSDAVLNMKDVQHGPKELADSLYHLKSVGMDNVQAMNALTASEHLASVGGSDLEATTNAVASAFKSGIEGAQDFNQAAATINATIGAGNLRLEDYVSAMGTGVMVNAKQAGASLTDVGAAIAMLTSRGIPATRAAMSLKMAFAAMAAPTDKMSKVLGDIGLKTYDLAKAVRTGGLPAAVQLLKDHLQGLSKTAQTADLTKMFGAKSSQAILTLIANTKDYARVQKQIVDNATSGAFQKAIEAQGKDAAAAWHKALADLSKAAVRIGDVLLPAAANIATAVGKVAGALDELGPAGTTAVVAFAGVLAAAGPVLTIMSKLSMLKMAKTLGGLGGGVPVVVPGGGAPAARFLVPASGAAGTTVAGAAGMSAASIAAIVAVALSPIVVAAIMTKTQSYVEGKHGAAATSQQNTGAGGAFYGSSKGYGAGSGRHAAQDAVGAGEKIAPLVQKLSVQMDKASYGEFRKLYSAIQGIQKLADKGIVLNTKNLGKQSTGDLRNLRSTMMDSLHITAKQAETILNTIAGKKLKFTWDKQTGKELAKTKSTVTSAGGKIVKDLSSSGQKAGSGLAKGLNAGQGPTKAAAAALAAAAKPNLPDLYSAGVNLAQSLANGMNHGVGPILQAVNALENAAQVNLPPIPQIRPPRHALGGVFRSPHLGLVAEAGPEAIIPLSNPSRAAQVMAEAGLTGRGGGSSSLSIGPVSISLGTYDTGEDAGSAAADAFMQRTREIARGY